MIAGLIWWTVSVVALYVLVIVGFIIWGKGGKKNARGQHRRRGR